MSSLRAVPVEGGAEGGVAGGVPVGGEVGGEVGAAVDVGRRLGLPVERPAVLHAGANAVVHLAPAPVVARVARLTARARPVPERALGREVALAGWLAARGAPVLPPTTLVDPGPHTAAGRWLSLWPHLDLPAGAGAHATGQPQRVAAALAALHDVASGYPGERLPGLAEVVDDAERCLGAGGAWLPADVLGALVGAGEGARVTAAAVDAGGGRRALHGDAHPGNLLRVGAAALWCDLEDAVTGPLEWDLAVAARSPRHDGAAALAAYAALTGARPDRDLLDALTRLRGWQADCWAVLAADDEPERRPDVLAALARRRRRSPGRR